MTKIVTSLTMFNDAVGTRMSVTLTEIDQNGRVTVSNKRLDKVVTEPDLIQAYLTLKGAAQEFVENVE